MAALFKKLGASIGKLADIINGTDADDETIPVENVTPRVKSEEGTEDKSQAKPTAKDKPEKKAAAAEVKKTFKQPEAPEPKEKQEDADTDIFNNAIDKRDIAVRAIVNEFREAAGTRSSALATLIVYVVVDKDDYDLKKYAWADESMREQLRLSLDNAMLESIGSKKLEIRFAVRSNIPEKAKAIIADTLYYAFGNAPVVKKHCRARITVVEGTGSLAKEEYILDSEKKQIYHLGRGPISRKPGAMWPNDIVIRDSDPDSDLQSRNNHVSQAHADIVAGNGRFYIKAHKSGCRALGGSSTKLIYDGDVHEVSDVLMKYPLDNDYMIELGKEVVLLFNYISE